MLALQEKGAPVYPKIRILTPYQIIKTNTCSVTKMAHERQFFYSDLVLSCSYSQICMWNFIKKIHIHVCKLMNDCTGEHDDGVVSCRDDTD